MVRKIIERVERLKRPEIIVAGQRPEKQKPKGIFGDGESMTAKVAQVERWLPIRGFEGYYEVSDLGRVRSVDRLIPHHISRTGFQFRRGRVLRAKVDRVGRYSRAGTLKVDLNKNGVPLTRPISRLVAEAFIGEILPGMAVVHRDPRRWKDNSLANLLVRSEDEHRSVTQDMSQRVILEHRREHAILGALSARRRQSSTQLVTPEKAEEIRRLYEVMTARQIAEHFGLELHTVRRYARGVLLTIQRPTDDR